MGSPLVDYDWYAFGQACLKASKKKTGERCMRPTNEQSCGSEGAPGGLESKSPLENEGGKGGGRSMLRPHA